LSNLRVELTRATASPWPRTYCFAHAGGDARKFVEWQDALAGVTEIVAVTPVGETAIDHVCDRVAEALSRDSDEPFVLFGHSLGALIAFEVARRLDAGPCHLIASGCAAPSKLPTPRMTWMATLEGQRFAEAVEQYGGLHPDVLADPDLQEIMLPAVHTDFELVAGYRYRTTRPLPIKISLINGRDDPNIQPGDLADWSRESVTEPEFRWSAGGHFYFVDRPEDAIDVIQGAVDEVHCEII
jgi:surfactin synthase thioesterase subunit